MPTKLSHTPGPWRLEQATLFLVYSGEDCLARGIEREADARLMSKAPALLAACEQARSILSQLERTGHLDALYVIEQAIRAAKGE